MKVLLPVFFIISLLFGNSCIVSAQKIMTVAGKVIVNNNIPATSARLGDMKNIAVDAAGNIYFAEKYTVQKITAATGIMTTVAGTGSMGTYSGVGELATKAQMFNTPSIALDPAGNLYIADASNMIRKVDKTTGIVSIVTGTGFGGNSNDGVLAATAKINGGEYVAADRTGNIYFIELFAHRVRKIHATTGLLSTIAGTGSSGFSGDGGLASAAQLNFPSSITIDTSGNVFIYDQGNARIRKVTVSTGIITTIAGNGVLQYAGDNGLATAASFFSAAGIATDPAGNFYISDASFCVIRRIDVTTGIIAPFVATNKVCGFSGDGGPAGSAQLSSPLGITFDASGNMYICDNRNARIRKVSASNGTISTIAGSSVFSGDTTVASQSVLGSTLGVAVDTLGNLFFVDQVNLLVRKVNVANGIMTTIAGGGAIFDKAKFNGLKGTDITLSRPSGIALDKAANVFFLDNTQVYKISAATGIITRVAGTLTADSALGDGALAINATFKSPENLVVDGDGNIYIADKLANRIRKITIATGIITTIAGNGTQGFSGDGGLAKAAQLYYPAGVTLDAAGNLYFNDSYNDCVRKIASGTGIITTIAGRPQQYIFSGDGGLAVNATINPIGIALDSANNLYVSDNFNNRIVRINLLTGILNTVAGTGVKGYSGDGGNPLLGDINSPSAITVDPSGRFYFSDLGNNIIRQVIDAHKIAVPVRTRHLITIHAKKRVASLEMSPAEYDSWIKNDDFTNSGKRQDLFQDIYSQLKDSFDFVITLLPETSIPSNITYFGLNFGVSNTTKGIGLDTYDFSGAYGSAGKLKSVMQLPRTDLLLYGPSLHELAHTWGQFLVNDSKDWNGVSENGAIPHWGFTGGNTKGQLGGFQQSTLKTNIGGNANKYSVGGFGGFANGGNSVPYNQMELYLMGMIPLSSVNDFDVFSGITQVAAVGSTLEFTAANRITYNNAKIVSVAKTERIPSSVTAQKDFRALVLVITPKPLTDDQWNLFDDHSEKMSRTADEGSPGYNFWEATNGLGTLQTGNLQNAIRGITIAASNLSVCAGNPITFTSYLPIDGGTSPTYQWTKNGIAIAGANAKTFTSNTFVNSDTIRCGLTNSLGTTTSDPLVVIVSPNTIVKPIISNSGSLNFCMGDSILLSSSVTTGNQWLLNDTLIDGAVGKNLLIKKTGSYSVMVTNAKGCTNVSAKIMATEFPKISKPIITNSKPLSFCNGDSTVLTSSASVGNQWLLNDTTIISGATGTSYTVKSSGLYSSRVTNAGGCSMVSDKISVTANPIPVKPTVTRPLTDLVSSSTAGNQWYMDTVVIVGANAQTYRPSLSGYYKTRVTLNSCSSVFSDVYYYLVTAVTNITNTPNDKYRIFPNPVTDILYVQSLSAIDPLQISIMDATGRAILTKDFNSRIEINMRSFGKGNYTVLLTDKKTKKQVSRLFIKL